MGTSNQLAEGSKRAFVSLLEYAEEELEVTHVVACLDRLHHDNKNVIRNFLFLGFQPIAPGHEFLPNNPNVVCFLHHLSRTKDHHGIKILPKEIADNKILLPSRKSTFQHQ